MMEALKAFLRDYHFLVSGAFGALASYVIMSWFYKGNAAPLETRGSDTQIFRHSPRTRKLMYGLAGACALMAALPAYALIYPDQWTPKLLLILGFGFGTIYCLLEVRRALVIIKPKHITVSGAFSAKREVAYSDVVSVKSYDTLQMLCLITRSGQRLWISYMMANFGVIIERLNQRGLAVDTQQPALDDMATALAGAEGKPELVWFMLPFLSVWKLGVRHAAVLARFSETGFEGYFVHYSNGSAHTAAAELLAMLRNKEIAVEAELADAMATDLEQVLANKLAWSEV